MTRVVVDVMLKPEILDPQGQAVANALPRLGVDEVASVRIGRRIELEFDGPPDLERVNQLADGLLANPVIENYTITVEDGHTGARAAGRVAAAPTGRAPVAPAAAGEATASGETLSGETLSGETLSGEGAAGEGAAGEVTAVGRETS